MSAPARECSSPMRLFPKSGSQSSSPLDSTVSLTVGLILGATLLDNCRHCLFKVQKTFVSALLTQCFKDKDKCKDKNKRHSRWFPLKILPRQNEKMFQHKFCQVASVQVGRAVPQKVQQMRQKEGGGGGQEWQLLCLISAFTTPPSTCKSFPLRNATTLQWRISMMPKLTLSKGPTGGSKEWLQPSPQLTWHHLTLKLNAGVGGWAHLQSYRIHRKFAPFFAQIFAKKIVKCKNLHKKLRKHLRHDYFLAFICANICTIF